ncbi:MAG: LptF/LptG family permease [Bacteroidia bacterium]|nr:LptF/LptG family permease [Bacteroidia bacterium]MBT8275360.1 LptF/LptG family permease [Bacteroidia bacterium]NNF31933.1 YjgP/YjgQ family permease [Flavobacteriaceae bacterium]NNK53621.1 YjgP/YjgQ family permease [Flavobacteriaceae bacterium]NNM10135.1 YjgP/YjgQ family permease [Flavobacteriaceae bacterium]
MLSILDRYIIRKYLGTFILLLLLFIPIGITVNLAEKIDKILANEVPFIEVAKYYLDFTVYFANLLFPLFLFLSVIWFTSKLANNTEVIAFLSSGVSYYRFLRPYIIGATIVCIGALILGMYLAPMASKGFNEFTYKHLKKGKRDRNQTNVYRQINDNDYIYVSYFNVKEKSGNNFTLEHIEGNKMTYKISASRIKFNDQDSTYMLVNFRKRTILENEDILEKRARVDTTFTFELEDLTPVEYIAETLNYGELNNFIRREKERGSSYINRYEVVRYKRWSLPVSAYILTIIAVAVSSMKRRGGMGVNLAIGIAIGMVYIFFDKIFGTMAEQSTFSPFIATWFPNFVFGILAVYLLRNAKR